MRSRTALVFVLVVAFLVQGLGTDESRAGTPDTTQMLQLTNEDRADRERDALSLNEQLSRYATRHSRQMAERGEIFHTPDLGARLQGVDWSIGGENVGNGPTLAGLQRAFMASKPHRKNILREAFDHTAIGVVESGGSYWVTVIFYG
jgi:uncharacterized protein YkwD